ncbi:hypothetical protein [Brachyspira alvinipulli]|uniref:hypothetical protein n=1 Tax=Brachyspira alvinipulli TaxID=84379 RepID=UPI000481F54A|nr:hypothetical protein [Brachyspira alvinipulli]
MAFYEDMYYSLPETERETFINTLSEEDKNALMLVLKKKDIYSNMLDNHKERFESIYNELKSKKNKIEFLNILKYLDDNKREKLLDIIFNNINSEEILYDYSDFDKIKNILPQYNDKLDKFSEWRRFKRILRYFIDKKIIELLAIVSEVIFEIKDNAILRITTLYKYNFNNKNNEKLLNMLYKLPEEKRIYFFEEFEKNEEFKDIEFIKMLRVILNMNRESFLYIFTEKEIGYDITNYIDYHHMGYPSNEIYNKLTSQIEKYVFLKILECIMAFQIEYLIKIFNNLDENMQNSVNWISLCVGLERLEKII